MLLEPMPLPAESHGPWHLLGGGLGSEAEERTGRRSADGPEPESQLLHYVQRYDWAQVFIPLKLE